MRPAINKQELLDDISALLGIERFQCARGGSEPREFLIAVAKHLDLDFPPKSSKPILAQLIVTSAKLPWEKDFSSEGSTVTNAGLSAIKQAVTHWVAVEKSTDKIREFAVDLTPKVDALKLFKNLSFSLPYALGEFIDNSITSAIQNLDELKRIYGDQYQLEVEIKFDREAGSLTIIDNAGGISENDFGRALQTSQAPPDVSQGLSLHGVGMKAASFWLGRSLSIESHPVGQNMQLLTAIDLEHLDSNLQVLVRPAGGGSGMPKTGTRITIEGLWRGVPGGRSLGALKVLLPSIYRNFLKSADGTPSVNFQQAFNTRITLNDEPLVFERPKLLECPFWPSDKGPEPDGVAQKWYTDVHIVLSDGKAISGWVGIMQTMTRQLSGFMLNYRGKGIAGAAGSAEESDAPSIAREAYRPRAIFGQRGSNADGTLIGEFDVSEFGKSITTDAVMWSIEQEEEFISLLHAHLTRPEFNLLAQARNIKRRQLGIKIEDEDDIVSDEAQRVKRSIEQGHVSHKDGVEIGESPLEIKPSAVEKIEVSDDDGHTHVFHVEIISSPDAPMYRVVDDQDTYEHRIVVNIDCAGFAGFGAIEGVKERMLVRVLLAFGVAEIFLEGVALDRVRNKANQLIETFGSVS